MKLNRNVSKAANNENGYMLIGTLFILLLLIIIGMAATTDTTLEIHIAGNDRTHRETFYQADGGTQIAIRLIEENLGAAVPFTALTSDSILVDPDTPNSTILIVDDTLSNNGAVRTFTDVFDDMTVGGGRDAAYFPDGYNPALPDPDILPHTNIIADGITSTVTGAGLQQLAGYEGKGKGTAGGGGQILYTIYSQHIGKNQSESIIAVQWRHVIGLELEGRY